MPARLLNVTPLVPARDVEEAIAFYRDRIGYLAENASLRILVDDVDALYADCQAAGCVHPNGALATRPWGSREFSVLDPSGVCIAFVQAGE